MQTKLTNIPFLRLLNPKVHTVTGSSDLHWSTVAVPEQFFELLGLATKNVVGALLKKLFDYGYLSVSYLFLEINCNIIDASSRKIVLGENESHYSY